MPSSKDRWLARIIFWGEWLLFRIKTLHVRKMMLNDEKFAPSLAERVLLDFVKHTFVVLPSMEKVSADGVRSWQVYNPKKFDSSVHKKVEGGWDHEHCRACDKKIKDGNDYWENSQYFILCPECYVEIEELVKS